MNFKDWLVGVVAVVIGFVTLLSGVLNWESTYRLRPARWIEAKYGRAAARVFYAVLGAGLIALGIAVSQGYVLFRS